MERQIFYFTLPSGNRETKRLALVSQFLNEAPGSGNGDSASRYQYNVETFQNYSIYLLRPTRLNKGFDFTVNISGLAFKKSRVYHAPSHDDIIDALESCKANNPSEYPRIKSAIHDIYNCEDPDLSLIHADFYDFNGVSHPIQIILLAIKWLFMEQDCAYWNYSGRQMFFDALCSSDLA